MIVLVAFDGFRHYIFNGAHWDFLRPLCGGEKNASRTKAGLTVGTLLLAINEEKEKGGGNRKKKKSSSAAVSPFVPIHN